MGVYSIEEVLGDVNNGNFKQMLEKAKSDHQQLQDEIQILLDKYLHRDYNLFKKYLKYRGATAWQSMKSWPHWRTTPAEKYF